MKIGIIGTGYVGLVTGTCLADLGNDVICVDINPEIVNKLNRGKIHIFEPGLKELVDRNVKEQRINFTTNIKRAIESSDIMFIAVGTPQDKDGSADLKYVLQVGKDIAQHINGYKIVVIKSTVPVGTSDLVRQTIKKNLKGNFDFDMVSNPETLREGEALKDFMNPDRVILGVDNKKTEEIMTKLYKGLERADKPIIVTDIKSAEIIKYSSNAMLATRISFMNMLAPLCERMGGNIKDISKGMGFDSRIGPRFLQAGAGYGGSCFPKDVRALANTLRENDLSTELIDAVDNVNECTKSRLIGYVKKAVGDLEGKTIAVWGLAFKPKTDDMREAPSITLIKDLQKSGAHVRVFDPEAMDKSKEILSNVEYSENPYHTANDADAVVLITEWDEFRSLNKEKIKGLLKEPNFIDLRNIHDPEEMRSLGFKYTSVGR